MYFFSKSGDFIKKKRIDNMQESFLDYDDVLFHGEHFQVIKELEGKEEQFCQGILLDRRSLDGQDSSWKTNCAVMDGGLQLAVTWFKDQTNYSSLPTDIERYEVFAEPEFGLETRCHLSLRKSSSLKSKWDIDYVDVKGRPIARIQGLSIHAVPNGY